MTGIKNGMKSILRTPLKTILFVLVSVLLAALLTVSLCVFSAVRTYLTDCDAYYHTIADLEYIGNDYPSDTVFDEAEKTTVDAASVLFDRLLNHDSVLYYETESNAAAIVDGFHRWDAYIPNPDKAVLRLYDPVFDERLGSYMAIISKSYYAQKDYTNKLIMMSAVDMEQENQDTLVPRKSYYAIGRFVPGQTSNPWFFAESTVFKEDDDTTVLPAFASVDENAALEEMYLHYADLLRLQNDCCRVEYTSAIDDYPPFQQQMLSVMQGRTFTEKEYRDAARVCIVSEKISGALSLSVGDSLTLTVYRTDTGLYDPDAWIQTDDGEYEIVGIYNDSDEYPYRIFLPDANAVTNVITPVTGYHLGHFRVENHKAESFLEAAQPLTEYGFRITIYDQGYAAATEPMRELLLISVIFLSVCLLLASSAHALQSHLFVSRQKEAALTMYALGSGKAHILRYFTSAALLLAIVSSVLGCVIGKLLEGRVMDTLQRFALQFADHDFRFSDSRLSLSRTLAFEPAIRLRVYLLAAALLILGTLFFTLLFAARTLRSTEGMGKKRKTIFQTNKRRETKSSRLSCALKYAVLSIRRGIVRTVAVILLCAIAAVFFGQMTASLNGYQTQLKVYRENAVITGHATDYSGKMTDGLLVSEQMTRALLQTELISSHCFTDTFAHGRILGIVECADGTSCDLPIYEIPETEFQYEGLVYHLQKGIRWVNTLSVGDSPACYYTKDKEIHWVDGYSEDSFRTNLAICALPNRVMQEQGLSLGDVIRILYVGSRHDMAQADVKIVASYTSASPKPIVYSPIGYNPAFDTAFSEDTESVELVITEEAEKQTQEESFELIAPDGNTITMTETEFNANLNELIATGVIQLNYRTYDSFRFTLDRADDLDALRQALDEAGFTYVRSGARLKPFAIIEDEIYLNTTHSMERQIQYVGVLYDALYIIAGVIGLVLAWLMTLSRRKEISVMRAMGTQPFRILLNFQTEQFVLSGAGILLGVLIAYLSGCALTPLFCILVGAFWIIWNLSTLLCLITGLLKPSYASLTEPE